VRDRLWSSLASLSALLLVIALSACGGGGQSGSGGSPPAPDFILAVSPSSVSLQSGSGATIQVTVNPVNSFAGTVDVQVSSIPSGISLSQTQFSVSASSSQSVTISASSSAAAGNYSLTFQGISGSLAHSATLAVAVNAGTPLPSRADFVPTYDTPAAGVYDMAHKLVYVSNPTKGTVHVISSTTYQMLKSIPIPKPVGLDLSVDGSKVYVGTDTQALYVIDTGTQEISRRYFAPAAPPTGAGDASEPQKLAQAANGKLVLLAMNDGFFQLTTWDLSSDTYQARTDVSFSFDNTAVLARSGDGSKVILANDVSQSSVILYDSATDSFISSPNLFGYAFSVAANANGTQFAVASDKIYILDAQLNSVATLPGSAPVKYSPDGSKLYLVGFLGNVPVVQTFDTKTFNLIVTAPSYATNIAYFKRDPPLVQETPLVADETGRVFGSADHGLAIDDATDLHAYSGNETFPIYNIIVNPGEGPTNVQQNVQIETQAYTAAPSIWFGGLAALNTNPGSPYLVATTPGSEVTGPVNVRLIDTDAVQSFIPQSYSYGSTLIPSPDLGASSAGGGSLSLFGYGLGALGTQATTQVSVGSAPAQVTKTIPYAAEQPYPFAMTHVELQPPPTSPGVYDITVNSATGSSTFKGGYHSVGMNSYALDAQPYSIVFDSHRNQIYISTSNHVDVFSLTSATFLTPLSIPTINHVSQLGGMALSPDGSSLLVSNWADGSVAVVNPDNPSTARAVAVVPPANSTPYLQGPQEVAVGNKGRALISVGGAPFGGPTSRKGNGNKTRRAGVIDGNGPAANLWELDLSTLAVIPVVAVDDSVLDTVSLRSSDDGSKICLAGEYLPLSLYDSATDTFLQGPGQGGSADCALNGTAAIVGGTPFGRPALLDLALDFNGFTSLTDYTEFSLSSEANVTGLLMDPQGALLCQPFTQELILYDVHTGQILERIAMGTNVERINAGALAWDTAGLQIFALTDSGVTVVQLDSLPLAIGHITASGSTWTVSGTGFVQGTSLSVGGTTLSTTFVNSQTLKVAGAPNLSTAEGITLTNPNGHDYTIAAAFVR